MSAQLHEVNRTRSSDITYQDASLDIWDKKYRLKSKTGDLIDQSIDDTYKRVARALAEVEDEARRDESTSSSSGLCATVPFRPAALPPMPARWNINRPPPLSIAPCPAPSPIR